MRVFGPAIVMVALALVAASAGGAERFATVVLPVRVTVKEKPGEYDPGEYVLDRTVMGMKKVARFDVADAGDVGRILKDHLFKDEDVKVENAADIAKAFKARLLLFLTVDKLTLEVETEDRVLIQTQVAVCTVSVGGTLFDAKTGKSVTIGPFTEEEQKMGAKDELKRFTITSKVTEQMIKRALDRAAKKVRSRIYKLYPLAGKVSLVDGDVVTIDIGTKMGVKAGYKFIIFGMVEREHPITGLKEKVREEISLLEVDGVEEESAKCRVVKGEKNPQIGDAVLRKLKKR